MVMNDQLASQAQKNIRSMMNLSKLALNLNDSDDTKNQNMSDI